MNNIDLRRPSPIFPPPGLWSLWNMIDLYGAKILAVTAGLMSLTMELRERERQLEDEQERRYGQLEESPRPVAAKLEAQALETLEMARQLIDELGLESSAYQLATIHRENDDDREFARWELSNEIGQLQRRIVEEVTKRSFLYIAPGIDKFWGKKDAFNLGKKFKEAHGEIEAAGNCFSYQQPTACVFHLMRAMEVVVRQLAQRPHMNITIAPKTTWRQITGAMDQKIKAMPESTIRQKRKKEDWESARANLHHVGSVWRNNTMHPAKTYTQSQARDVFDACRVFMSGLCDL
jgi:hypothetical protein